jgi:endonuclease G
MPSSAIVHAAVFTAGALLGGGIAAAVSRNQRPRTPAPVIDVDPTGKTKLSVVPRSDLPVLKYGHPGMFCPDVGR